MHIVFYTNGWPRSQFVGGINTYIECLRDQLIEEGHKVSILTPRLGEDCEDPDVHLIAGSKRVNLLRRISDWLHRRGDYSAFTYGCVIADEFRRLHRKSPIDIIEMEESFGYVRDVQRALPVPVVVKLHGPLFLAEVAESLEEPFIRRRVELEGRALQNITNLTAPSECTLRDTVEHYALAPRVAQCVRNPLPVDNPVPLWSLQSCDPHKLLFVGRFDRIKGGDVILHAFKQLLQTHPDLQLTFVGPDRGLTRNGTTTYMPEFMDSLFDEHERARVTYLGELKEEQIQQLRIESIATLIASVWESGPYTALEAMLQGCPVVAVNNGGVGEIVTHGENGLLARSADLDDLCAQISAILDNPELGEKLGAAAKEYVKTHHSPQNIAAQTLQVYRRAIGSCATDT